MGQEIERKYLVKHEGWRHFASEGIHLRQGYLCMGGACSVRVRSAGAKAYLNLKSATLGISRSEFDYPVPLADAEEILETLCLKPLIEKTRYLIKHGDHVWEIDVFEGDNLGLVVAEIELTDPNEPFELPEWTGIEVSNDPRYYNVSLVNDPYKGWRSL